ncbi:hypothetical protein [Actinokineospora globicatena]|uniref:Uncharacterized protein n=1 Tax=Actinokineospora globicatena TaxID=103729 RepID=A0A9W6VDW8_9PSEU|nr:hypothetical protein [Actinokineospora globicatena]MCP2302186.1 hypothetical protein [Actinokineospora globicatena]GLW76150.1 hypothetical protein Aglo01_06320 [Actinokineospora globicatena]GLW82986.1 hypothetical protein Aglo02_06260 [Actinokineospora globicatena]GLW95721.1 hypothetical protein Aglo03_65370 [Actinokineospora globicatena]
MWRAGGPDRERAGRSQDDAGQAGPDDAGEPLRAAVLRRLALLDEAAGSADASTLLPLARAEISRLADGWRLLLTVHQPDEDSRCQACPAGLRGLRGKRWPCQVWRMAHEHLIGEGVPHRDRKRPLRNPFARQARLVPPESPCEVTDRIPVVRDDSPGERHADAG